jgi:predicted PurR-regulated permease PerM
MNSFAEDGFVRRVLTAVAIVAFSILLVWALMYIFDVILLLFAAILLAIFLHGLADYVIRYTGLSEGKAVLLTSLALVASLAFGIWLLAPDVADQIKKLRVDLPIAAQNLTAQLAQYNWGRLLLEQIPSTDEIFQRINKTSLLSRVGGYFSSTLGAIANFSLVVLLAIYLASEPRMHARGFSKLFPVSKRHRLSEILTSIYENLRWWLIGKAASMLFIGLVTWIGLYLIGVPLSLTLGLITGLLAFIPNFGPILSAIPAILLGFIDSPIKALYVVILYVGVQLIESNVVTPLIERETVELPPALTILAQLALGVLIGGLGLVLATPLLAVFMVLVQMLYIEDILGDRATNLDDKTEDKDTNLEAPAPVSG